MSSLTDYLDLPTLQQLQDAFAAVAKLPLRLCCADGKPLTKPSPVVLDSEVAAALAPAGGPEGRCNVPIMVRDEMAGRISLDLPKAHGKARHDDQRVVDITSRSLRYLGLMANVISRLCDREMQLRARIDDLATLYRLTAEFTNRRDLPALLSQVANTVVEVLKAKSCSIRLLSDDRTELLVKAVANLSGEYLNKGAILVSQSAIDQEAISTGKSVYIADEQTDPRVMFPAQAAREGIVSALCAPLMYKGHPEGVIHVYTGRKHVFDRFEQSLLEAIAAQAAAAIVNARLYQEAVHLANMKRQLLLAGEVQRRMIPSSPPHVPGFDIGGLYVPSYELSGDFYDFIDLPPDNLGVVICDVVGKGVRASLLMASIRASLRAHASNIYDMSQVMARVNRDLCAEALISDFATLFYGVLDYRSRRFTYSNAGHPPPLLVRAGEAAPLLAGGGVLGIDANGRWGHESFALNSGDAIVAYTDGLSEAMNFDDEPFGRQRLTKAAATALAEGKSAESVARHMIWEMRRFAGLQTGFDDLTLVVIKVL